MLLIQILLRPGMRSFDVEHDFNDPMMYMPDLSFAAKYSSLYSTFYCNIFYSKLVHRI